ncbi:MAG: DUF6089 family protein [Candidatus Delongbacteria bacterium]|jgi:hypothetical protein|nr:DUF6089 family protein [Candidatus Delongbacteria bacterium]
MDVIKNNNIKITIRHISLSFVFIILSFSLHAQQAGEIGIHAGGSYYLGEINWGKPFYSPRLNVGAFYKQHINSRVLIKYGALYTHLQGDDEDSRFRYQRLRDARFEPTLFEAAAQVEFHFLLYELGKTKDNFYTPYVDLGLGGCYARESSNHVFTVIIPMAVGIKMNLTRRIVVGAEWAFRKTYSDMLDNLTGEDLDLYEQAKVPLSNTNDVKQHGFMTNDDWYSYAAVTLSYIFSIGSECHAYY